MGNSYFEKHEKIESDDLANLLLKSKSKIECLSSFIQSKSKWVRGGKSLDKKQTYELEIDGGTTDQIKLGGK